MQKKQVKEYNKEGKNKKGFKDFIVRSATHTFLERYDKNKYPDDLKRIAIRLYTDGVEIAVISCSLEVPYETVRSWIRAEGESYKKLK